tara:strand:+ start:1134 stop:1877 length:744 start_codon:yes stop_codon:yes gene_type:complete
LSNIFVDSELSYLFSAANICIERKEGADGAWQVAPFFCSIPFSEDSYEDMKKFANSIEEEISDLYSFGKRRAYKAFGNEVDSVTKPSYLKRINNYNDDGIDQFENILSISEKEFNSGGLVFSVFDPMDLIRRKRPGYVPCLVSGSFLVHNGELQLNAFFRSQSVVEFGVFDLIFLRDFQRKMFEEIKKFRAEEDISIGSLNLHFARVIIQRRFARSGKKYLKREEVINNWMSLLEINLLEARMRSFS